MPSLWQILRLGYIDSDRPTWLQVGCSVADHGLLVLNRDNR